MLPRRRKAATIALPLAVQLAWGDRSHFVAFRQIRLALACRTKTVPLCCVLLIK